MKDVLANLLKVKSLMTIAVAACLIGGFFLKMIPSEQFMQIAIMVFTFYFAKNAMDESA